MAHMKVRYNPLIGVLAVVLGGVSLCSGFLERMLRMNHTRASSGEMSTVLGLVFHPPVICGLVVTVLGILCLTRPYFWLMPRKVMIGTLVGPVSQEFRYVRLEPHGRRLYAVGPDGTRTKLPVARWLTHHDGWRAVTGRR